MNNPITIDNILEIRNHKTLTQVLWIGAFTLLTTVGAQIAIPTYPVPITLQTFFVILSGAMLGARRGAASQMMYLIAGVSGVPVFANGASGPLHLVGPTGGYLIAFPIAAFVIGYLIHDVSMTQSLPKFFAAIISMGVGIIIIFLMGVAQLYATIFHDWSTSFNTGFVALQWWDGLKLIAAASIYTRIASRYSRVAE